MENGIVMTHDAVCKLYAETTLTTPGQAIKGDLILTNLGLGTVDFSMRNLRTEPLKFQFMGDIYPQLKFIEEPQKNTNPAVRSLLIERSIPGWSLVALHILQENHRAQLAFHWLCNTPNALQYPPNDDCSDMIICLDDHPAYFGFTLVSDHVSYAVEYFSSGETDLVKATEMYDDEKIRTFIRWFGQTPSANKAEGWTVFHHTACEKEELYNQIFQTAASDQVTQA